MGNLLMSLPYSRELILVYLQQFKHSADFLVQVSVCKLCTCIHHTHMNQLLFDSKYHIILGTITRADNIWQVQIQKFRRFQIFPRIA